MIVAIVRFQLPEPVDAETAARLVRPGTSYYEGREDLLRKTYIRSPDGTVMGAVYFWRSLEDATAFHNEEWRTRVAKKYGSEPSVELFEAVHVVDNERSGAAQG